MIVCPECRFENPDDDRFCQECGLDLQPQLDSQHHSTSGRFDSAAGDRDRPLAPESSEYPAPQQIAIVLGPAPQPPGPTSETPANTPANPPPATAKSAAVDLVTSLSGSDGCLAGRYQVQPLGNPASYGKTAEDIEITVVDTQPSAPTLLAIASALGDDDFTDETLDRVLATLPELVRTHLLLQDELYPSCPQVYDTWEQEEYTVLFLEGRTLLPSLIGAVESTAVDEQVLHWCYDTVQLWELLTPYQCHQSLLTLDNLRVDSDQILCLKRLHQNREPESYPLSRLGTLWRQVFGSAFDRIAALRKLCETLERGEIDTIALVKQRLETIRIDHDELLLSPLQGDRPANKDSQPTDAMAEPTMQSGHDDPFDDSDDLPTVVLPMQLYSLSDAGQTDVGRQRKHNEDCFFVQTDVHKMDSPSGRICKAKGLYILCDGMGGHASGEVASKLAVESLRQNCKAWTNQLPTEPTLSEWIQQANQAIYDRNQQDDSHGNRRMGTTLVMLMVQGLHVAIAHVGDSRLYRVTRKLGLEQLTVDHEVGQREIHRGIAPDIAYSRQDAYQLTQALGPRGPEFLRPDVLHLPITEDALFILASDGLTDNDLLEQHYDTHVEPLLSSQTNLEQGVANLIGLANQHNGHDNITTIAVRIKLRPILQPIGM
ncbi:MAG: serine/threonine phosphatase [Elainellaceae cyanobacterium]